MKKKILIVLLLIISLFTITACGEEKSEKSNRSDKKEGISKKLTKKEIGEKLYKVNNDLTDLWNEVICQVSHYSYDGTSSTGESLDIEFVVKTSKKYYDKVKENKEFVDSLGEEYADIIEAYDKAFEQATILYDKIQKETPTPNTSDKYEKEIALFEQYSDYFYDHYDDYSEEG